MTVVGLRGCSCCRCGVPWEASSFSFVRPSKSSSYLSLGFEPNAPAHRERPDRGPSAFPHTQRGRDAVARRVRLSSSVKRRSFPSASDGTDNLLLFKGLTFAFIRTVPLIQRRFLVPTVYFLRKAEPRGKRKRTHTAERRIRSGTVNPKSPDHKKDRKTREALAEVYIGSHFFRDKSE